MGPAGHEVLFRAISWKGHAPAAAAKALSEGRVPYGRMIPAMIEAQEGANGPDLQTLCEAIRTFRGIDTDFKARPCR
jgi:hypothetical protein